MRFRPANIRVINRRENYLDHDLRCLLTWIIHEFTGEKRKDALKGVMNTGF
jgi:hypothetical protein